MTKQIAKYETQTRKQVEIRATDGGKVWIAINSDVFVLTRWDAREMARVLEVAAVEADAMGGEVP